MEYDFSGYQDHSINGGDDVLTISYTEFIAPMVKTIQELYRSNQELQTKVSLLEQRFINLDNIDDNADDGIFTSDDK